LLAATLLVPTLKAKPANWLWELLAAVLLLKENQQSLFRSQFAGGEKNLFFAGTGMGVAAFENCPFSSTKTGQISTHPLPAGRIAADWFLVDPS
jgi:hypothetical protein